MSKWFAAVAVLATLSVGACGSDGTEAQPAVCDSLTAVQNSMDHVRNANVSENGLSQIRTDLRQLRTDLQQLYTDAQAQFAPQAQAVKESVDRFSATVSTARTAPDAANLAAVRSAFTTVQDSVRGLADAMAGTC